MRLTFRSLLVLVPATVVLGGSAPPGPDDMARTHTIQPDLPEIREESSPAISSCDLNADHCVDVLDLLLYIPDWQMGSACADVDGDGSVGATDLLLFIDCVLSGPSGA